MNNLSSYCGLVDARISASDKDLPLQNYKLKTSQNINPLTTLDHNLTTSQDLKLTTSQDGNILTSQNQEGAEVEGDSQNLQMINGRFKITYGPFFSPTKGLNLNWFKSYGQSANICDFVKKIRT